MGARDLGGGAWRSAGCRLGLVAGLGLLLGGCVSVAEFRKLERDLNRMKSENAVGSDARSGLADLSAELERMRGELAELQGRVEVAEHKASSALGEARAARQAAHGGGGMGGPAVAPSDTPDAAGVAPEELSAYREAYAAWRGDDTQACIDRFREFLQTHASSEYADDAAYWMADCHFKQGDYRAAVLRFDDVAGRYPTGNKAADALYRQGEALLRLGYGEAAVKAFERVLNEYPDSERAVEARRQVDLLRRAG